MPFQYTPNRNPYVGSITDLMGRGRDAEAQALITAANAQAQAAQASGQAWGGAVQSIGNTIGAIPGQLQAQQDRDMALADRARVIKQRELEDADRANRERASAMFAERISPKRVEGQPVEGPNSMPPVPTQHPYQVKQDGAWLFDVEGFQRAAAEAGPGVLEQVGPYINQMSSMNQWRQGVIESGKQEAQRQAVFLSQLSDDELLRVLPVAMRGLEGVFDEAVADGLMGLVRNGDAVGVRKVLNGFTGRQSDRVTVKPGETIRDLSTGEEIEGGPLVAKPVGSLREVSRNGVPVLVQPYSDGSVRDVPGLDPAIDQPSQGGWATLENQGGEQRFVRRGSQEAADMLGQGWRVRETSSERPPSQAQYLAGGYGGRMVQAEEVFARLTGDINAMHPWRFKAERLVDDPYLQSDLMQSYMQAARNFINAQMRRESGAAIAPHEFENANKQYLPLPGDSEETSRQKAANRQYVTDTMVRSAGPAYEAPGAADTLTVGADGGQDHWDAETQQMIRIFWHEGVGGEGGAWLDYPAGMPFPQED